MRFLAPALLAASAILTPSVQACSFTWAPGWSPDEIKERTDVRKVRGTYRLLEIAGERFINDDGEEWVRDATYLGRLDTARGTGWDVAHEPRIPDLTCIYYFKPEADATGTFWISRRKEDGRYRLLLWEGDYISAKPGDPIAPSERN